MLPDLANLVGAKPPPTQDLGILEGYELHFTTDRLFHESFAFREACAAESRRLTASGMRRGTAVAAAHVALELLLDDALLDDEQAGALFRSALSAAGPEALAPLLEWPSQATAGRFETLRQRLELFALNWQESLSPTLAERVTRTLSNRPRLAVRAGDRELLQDWTGQLAQRCDAIWPGLVEAVTAALDDATWQTMPALARRLRFRRAQADEL